MGVVLTLSYPSNKEDLSDRLAPSALFKFPLLETQGPGHVGVLAIILALGVGRQEGEVFKVYPVCIEFKISLYYLRFCQKRKRKETLEWKKQNPNHIWYIVKHPDFFFLFFF